MQRKGRSVQGRFEENRCGMFRSLGALNSAVENEEDSSHSRASKRDREGSLAHPGATEEKLG